MSKSCTYSAIVPDAFGALVAFVGSFDGLRLRIVDNIIT